MLEALSLVACAGPEVSAFAVLWGPGALFKVFRAKTLNPQNQDLAWVVWESWLCARACVHEARSILKASKPQKRNPPCIASQEPQAAFQGLAPHGAVSDALAVGSRPPGLQERQTPLEA